MSRDIVLCTLSVCVCGVLTLMVAHLPLARESILPNRSGADAEARAWWRLWLPLLPALWALAALVGWAAQEPTTTDELLRPLAFVLATPLALLAARAAVRRVKALRGQRFSSPAATIGLIRPRVLLSNALREQLDGPALSATMAHERAHARHRDPLRIWLAELATDLQWPSPWAVRRFRDWYRALELARDEEARAEGVRGEDLAAAIIAATKFGAAERGRRIAALTSPAVDVALRVHRLLDPLAPRAARRKRRVLTCVIVTGLLAASAAGLCFGDTLLRALPIVTV